MAKFTTFSLVISLWLSLSYVSSYSYRDLNLWNINDPICGDGRLQSPIDLVPTCQTRRGLPLVLKNYGGKLTNARASNTGTSVKITGDWGGNVPTVTGALVNNEQYLLGEVHHHWSDDDETGTEHSINGKRYACEVHFVHYNSKYGSIGNAVNMNDGLLVIGLLFKVDREASSSMGNIQKKGLGMFGLGSSGPNDPGLQAVAKLVSTVSEIGAKGTGTFDLSVFEIDSMKSFYTYAGSLTSPPCAESVRWVVVNELFPTNPSTMNVIRSAKLNDNGKHNVRPVQPLNGREIILYRK